MTRNDFISTKVQKKEKFKILKFQFSRFFKIQEKIRFFKIMNFKIVKFISKSDQVLEID